MSANRVIKSLQVLANKDYADHSSRFFKTGPGEYSEGDRFLGIRVPVIRAELKTLKDSISIDDTIELLQNPWHEVRLFALLAMVDKYRRADEQQRGKLVGLYLKHKEYVNNWDLVDGSAPYITGPWFYDKNRNALDRLIVSKHLWDRRIAMLSTFYYIRQNDLDDTFKYAEILLDDKEDLMHKAAGWMLREAGKRDEPTLTKFLNLHLPRIPRTMLRYAIEKYPSAARQQFLKR